MTRQRTTWLFHRSYLNGLLRIGFVHNLNPKNARIRDVVRLQGWKDGKIDMNYYMRPDEAMAMVAGLSWVVGQKWVGEQEVEAQRQERKSGKRDKHSATIQ